MQRPRLRIPQVARPAEMRGRVDLLLVLAVDASASISAEEASMQQHGYQRALPHREVLDAIASGQSGAIAIATVAWALLRNGAGTARASCGRVALA